MNTERIRFLLKRRSPSVVNGFNTLSELGYVCSWLESLCDWYGDFDILGCNKNFYNSVEDYWNYSDGFYGIPIALALVLTIENAHHSTAKQVEAFAIFSSGILLVLFSYYAKPRNNSRGLNDVFSQLIAPGMDASDIGFAVGSLLDLGFAAYKYQQTKKLETLEGWVEEKLEEVAAYRQQLSDFADLSGDEDYEKLKQQCDELEATITRRCTYYLFRNGNINTELASRIDEIRRKVTNNQAQSCLEFSQFIIAFKSNVIDATTHDLNLQDEAQNEIDIQNALVKNSHEALTNMLSKAVAFAGWTTLALGYTMGGWAFIVPLSFYYVYKNVPDDVKNKLSGFSFSMFSDDSSEPTVPLGLPGPNKSLVA